MAITSLQQLDFDKTYTYADYLQWKVKERLELLRGKIALMSPAPSMQHQRVSSELHGLIWNHLKKQNGPCQLFSAPFDVRLARKSQPNPDETIYTVV